MSHATTQGLIAKHLEQTLREDARLPRGYQVTADAVVHNLPEHGTVQVNTAIRPESVMLTVENTGDKLTAQLVSTLTEPFQRGTERKRTDHAGVGLGLAIVKSITQAHDGTLTIVPRPDGGLRVTVQLPAAPPHTGS